MKLFAGLEPTRLIVLHQIVKEWREHVNHCHIIATFSSTFMLECAFLVLEWLMPKKGRFHRENSLSE
jgi:hypothetical protein